MILHEIHKKGKTSWNNSWKTCQCNYCQGKTKLHYGLNIPKDRGKTSWWIIKYWKGRYIRWSNDWLKELFDSIENRDY